MSKQKTKLLQKLTVAELDWNVERLQKEAKAATKHADALAAYRLMKFGNDRTDQQAKEST
jgi:hypothetical protein